MLSRGNPKLGKLVDAVEKKSQVGKACRCRQEGFPKREINYLIYSMRNMINNFSRHNAKNAQHVYFTKEIVDSVTQEVADELGFGQQRAAFATAGNNEIANYKPEKALFDTTEVEATDGKREDIFTYHKQIVKTIANYSLDEEKKAAAQRVAYAFNEVGDIFRMDYMSETTAFDDLVETLRTEPYITALATINMSDAADELEAANNKFREAYKNRATAEYERAQKTSLKTLRSLTDDAFNEMVKTIEAIYTYNELITKDEEKREALQKVIDDINISLLRLRKSISGNKGSNDEEETPDEPTDPEEPSTGDGDTDDSDDGEDDTIIPTP